MYCLRSFFVRDRLPGFIPEHRRSFLRCFLAGLSIGFIAVFSSPAAAETNLSPPILSTPDAAAIPPTAAVSYTLAESVEQALRTSPRINAAAFRIAGVEAETGIARGRMLPSVAVSAGRTYVRSVSASGQVDVDFIDQHTDSAALQVTQTLFSGMSLLKNYQRALLAEDLSRAEKASVEGQVILDVQTSFLDLLKARGDVATLQEAARRLEATVEAVRAFERVRLAPYADVLQAEVDLADTLQRLSVAESQVTTLKIRLNTLLGLPPGRPIDYADDFADHTIEVPWTLPESLAVAMTKRADLDVARKALSMAEKEAEIVYGSYFPRVDLQGSFVHQDRDYEEPGSSVFGTPVDRDYRTDYWTAGITLQWRLYEGGQTNSQYQRARSEIYRLRERLREVTDEVSGQVHTYYLTLDEARQRIASTAQAVEAARENQERAQVRFEARVGTIIELLDAQARLIRAETNYSQAQADFRQSLARLLYAMGERNAALQL